MFYILDKMQQQNPQSGYYGNPPQPVQQQPMPGQLMQVQPISNPSYPNLPPHGPYMNGTYQNVSTMPNGMTPPSTYLRNQPPYPQQQYYDPQHIYPAQQQYNPQSISHQQSTTPTPLLQQNTQSNGIHATNHQIPAAEDPDEETQPKKTKPDDNEEVSEQDELKQQEALQKRERMMKFIEMMRQQQKEKESKDNENENKESDNNPEKVRQEKDLEQRKQRIDEMHKDQEELSKKMEQTKKSGTEDKEKILQMATLQQNLIKEYDGFFNKLVLYFMQYFSDKYEAIKNLIDTKKDDLKSLLAQYEKKAIAELRSKSQPPQAKSNASPGSHALKELQNHTSSSVAGSHTAKEVATHGNPENTYMKQEQNKPQNPSSQSLND